MTGHDGRPGIGIVSDVVLQRHRLQVAVMPGLEVSFSGGPDCLMDYPGFPDAALWLVTLEDEADHPALFEHLLEHTDAPVLFGMDQAPKPGTKDYVRWERRLLNKLEKQLGHLEKLDSANDIEELEVHARPSPEAPQLPQWITPAAPGSVAEEIWVLGASLGGPAAVKTFLDHLPAGLPVGFVYAQHIDDNFTGVLTRVLGRHAHYQLKRAEEGYTVRPGTDAGRTGVVVRRRRPDRHRQALARPLWPVYRPGAAERADHFREHCHAILFSGMGNDGAIAHRC